MNETPPPIPDPPHGPPITDAAERLEQIVDDATPRLDCSVWVNEQLVAGRDADSLLAELLEQGWNAEVAEEIVEEQRRATRHLRGVVTREQVAMRAERRYRSSFRYAFRMAIGGLPLVCAHFLVSSLVSIFRRRRDDSPD